jgi:hypothetical protein
LADGFAGFRAIPRLLHVHRSPCIKIHHHSLSVMRRRQGMENGKHAKPNIPLFGGLQDCSAARQSLYTCILLLFVLQVGDIVHVYQSHSSE